MVNESVRYKRQQIIKQVGIDGQNKLRNAKVLVVGAGGLGSPILLYLSAAGIQNIGIIDYDVVDESNLNRQVLYSTFDIGKMKVDRAKEKIQQLNTACKVVDYNMEVREEQLQNIINHYDVVVEAVDNAETKYMINKVCVKNKKPAVFGSIKDFEGQVCVYMPNASACYECIYPYNAVEKTENGVIGAVAGMIGSLQALQTIKIILGLNVQDTLLNFNGFNDKFQQIKISKNDNCRICGEHQRELL